MPKIISRPEGKVAVPNSDSAYFQFTFRAFEELETAFGEDYLDLVIKGLAKMRMSIYGPVIKAAVVGADPAAAPFGSTWGEVNEALLDAIHLSISGKTFKEHVEAEEETARKRLMELQSDPRIADLLENLSSLQSGAQALGQG